MSHDPGPHPASLEPEHLLRDCSQTFQKGSGPGGQHRNKVETEVVLTHHPSGLRARAGERRVRTDNQREALRRLRLLLAVKVRRDVDEDAGPSALWRSRCRAGRVACNPRHRDFPAVLAEALDAADRYGWEPRSAAAYLECTASQLVKLVKDHPAAFAEWNARRAALSLHPLR